MALPSLSIGMSFGDMTAQAMTWQNGSGSDVLVGGAGADLIIGDSGSDVLLGGFGAQEKTAPEAATEPAVETATESTADAASETVKAEAAHSDAVALAITNWLSDASGVDSQTEGGASSDWLDASCLALLAATPALVGTGAAETRSILRDSRNPRQAQ